MKMKGTIQWFNTKKGFGFIKGEDGEGYFLHITELTKLLNGLPVNFKDISTNKGLQAQDLAIDDRGY